MEDQEETLLFTPETSLQKRKWYQAINGAIEQIVKSKPDATEHRKSTRLTKKLKESSVKDLKKMKKEKEATGLKSIPKNILNSDVVQNHPKIQSLRASIAAERKAREDAENYSEELKKNLLSQSKETKQQTALELQSRIGSLCGAVGQLTSQNAILKQTIQLYDEKIKELSKKA